MPFPRQIVKMSRITCVFFKASTRNAENNTKSTLTIKSPVVFLMVNFVYCYVIIVIAICLYGLCGRPATANPPEIRSRESHEIEMNCTELMNNDCSPSSTVQITDNDMPFRWTENSFSPLLSTRNIKNLDFFEQPNSWEGDWNKYWNCKTDF